jgi:hypothetical protein
MATSLVNADSLLAIDVGTVNTRAVLFDVVENRYRFLGAGIAPTTAYSPYRDISEGIRLALDQLQSITGRTLIGGDQQLIFPTQGDGSGVDKCVATTSVGEPLRMVVVGLLEDVSLSSALHLASTTYAQVAETLSLNDKRSTSTRLDTVMRLRPDVVIASGGTDGGASQSVMKLLEAVGLACYLLPNEVKPHILFAGNSALEKEVKSAIGSLVPLYVAPNIRPQVDVEQLLPAQVELNQVFRQVRLRQIAGIESLDMWSGNKLLPSAYAFARTVRYVSKQLQTKKGVLGIDVGASSTVVAAAYADDVMLSVHPRLGMGEGLTGLLNDVEIEEIIRWLPVEIAASEVRDFIYNKSIRPATLPVTPEELALEQALATQVIQLAVKKASLRFPAGITQPAPGLLPWFEPIIASGGVLSQAPARGQALLMLLNALQPTGVTPIILDQNGLAVAIGSAADANPLVTVQALDTTNFLNLCFVVSPVGSAKRGTPVLRIRVKIGNREESVVDVKYGNLEVIPLPLGQSANVHLQPFYRFDVGMGGPGRGGSVKVMGGVFGIVIDARGRPIALPAEPNRRRDLLRKWAWTLGS